MIGDRAGQQMFFAPDLRGYASCAIFLLL